MRPADDDPILDAELPDLFRPFEGRRLALAVSGGVDSMVLMHLVARWLAARPGQAWAARLPEQAKVRSGLGPAIERPIGLPARAPARVGRADWIGAEPSEIGERLPPVVVLTVDHRLRPESAQEAEMVAEAARRLGLFHQTLVWHHAPAAEARPEDPAAGAVPASGIQEKARAARYGLLADCIEAETWALFEAGDLRISPLSAGRAKRAIVTAHHRDDLVETFLMRLKRGSGLDGLASIRTVETLARPPAPDCPYPTEVDLVRPLLDVPKSRLVATASRLGLAWAEDQSNASRRFERVRLREDMGTLSALGLASPALHLTIRRLQRASGLVDARIREQLSGRPDASRQVELNGGLFASVPLSGPRIPDADPTSALDDGAEAEALQRMLQYLVAMFGGGEEPPGLGQLEEMRRHLVRSARQDARGDAQPPEATARTLAGCRLDYRRGEDGPEGCIRVWREAGREPLPQLQLAPGDGGWWDNRFAISIARDARDPVTVKALGSSGWSELRRRVPSLTRWRGIPPGAAATLPALWDDDRLVAVPYFDSLPCTLPLWLRHEFEREWQAGNGLAGAHVRARFAPALRTR